MQEIAIILSSLAGVATAAAVRRTPRTKTRLLSMGASSQIKNQINTLKIEKDILTKTIARLYQSDSDLTKIQRDKLLLRYQHQLGIILAKLEKLDQASKHPDLGPIGDGLITLMDQKLSKLDERLYELSSKITSTVQIPEIKKEKIEENEGKTSKPEHKMEIKPKQNFFSFKNSNPVKSEPEIVSPAKAQQSIELTTLTKISKKESKFPVIEKQIELKEEIINEVVQPKPKTPEKLESVQKISSPKSRVTFETKPNLTKEVEKITQFKALPEPQKEKSKPIIEIEDEFDEDSDDLDKIKVEIMNVLSKLDQAEVE